MSKVMCYFYHKLLRQGHVSNPRSVISHNLLAQNMHNSVSSSCSGGFPWCTVLFGSCSVTILCSNCFEETQGTLREFSLNQCDKLDGKKCFFDFRFRHKFSVTLQRIFQPLAPRPCTHKIIPYLHLDTNIFGSPCR